MLIVLLILWVQSWIVTFSNSFDSGCKQKSWINVKNKQFSQRFRFFIWQPFSTQKGAVRISLQEISFYAMIYFRVYWGELHGKIYCHHPVRISISFYFCLCQSGLYAWVILILLLSAYACNMFGWNFLISGLWRHILVSVNQTSMLQVLLSCLLERFFHKSHGLMKMKEKFWLNCGDNKCLSVFL